MAYDHLQMNLNKVDLTDFFELNKVLKPEPPGFGVSFSGVHVNLSGGIEEEALEVANIPMEIPGKSPEADTLNPPTVDTATSPFLSLEAKKLGGALPAIFKAKTPSIPQHPISRLIKRPSQPYRHWNSQTADSRYRQEFPRKQTGGAHRAARENGVRELLELQD